MIIMAFALYGGATPTKNKLPRDKFAETLKEMNACVKKHFLVCAIILISALVPILDSFLDTVTVKSDTGQYEQVSRLLQMDYSSGFGVFFLIVSYILIVGVIIWIIVNLNYDKKNRTFLEKLVNNYDKHQTIIADKTAQEEEDNCKLLASLSEKYGEAVKIIKPLDNSAEKAFIVFPDTHNLYINKKIIPFDQLVSCKLKDNTHTTVVGQKSAVTTTKTGSAIGRSVVGGLVAGPAGAIIGGSTAKKETEIIDNTQTITHHHYFVVISITDPFEPLITVDCGHGSAETAEEIKAIIDGIIVKRPKVSDPSNSIADELLKLADLKNRGILTESEFELQKQRILDNKS